GQPGAVRPSRDGLPGQDASCGDLPRGPLHLGEGIMRKLAQLGVVAGALGALLAFGVPAALADGNGARTFTQHQHHVTDTQRSPNPCTGDTGTLHETFNAIFHGTINKNGSWFTGPVEGKFPFVPDTPAAVTYTGHFQSWFGDENNRQSD